MQWRHREKPFFIYFMMKYCGPFYASGIDLTVCNAGTEGYHSGSSHLWTHWSVPLQQLHRKQWGKTPCLRKRYTCNPLKSPPIHSHLSNYVHNKSALAASKQMLWADVVGNDCRLSLQIYGPSLQVLHLCAPHIQVCTPRTAHDKITAKQQTEAGNATCTSKHLFSLVWLFISTGSAQLSNSQEHDRQDMPWHADSNKVSKHSDKFDNSTAIIGTVSNSRNTQQQMSTSKLR